jgi:hypothetical protein
MPVGLDPGFGKMQTSPLTAVSLPRALSLSRSSLVHFAGSWQTAAVVAVWLAAVCWTSVFVARHGHNLPAYDEWAFVQISYASFAEQFQWLGARHMEHRFPLARGIFLASLQLTGHDFRTGMWMTVGLLAGTSAFLILAARNLRGRTALADCAFPLLFLHSGHTENLLMGYQIAFTVTVFALAGFALVVARSTSVSAGRSALGGAVCTFIVANGGWLGLIFVPWLGMWTALQAWRASGDRMRRWSSVVVVAGIAAYVIWSAWKLLEVMHDGTSRAEAAGLAARIRAIAEVTGIGLGPGIGVYFDLSTIGWAIIAIQIITVVSLAVVIVKQPEERTIALGLITLMLGVWLFALGIGYSRGSGLASRYTTFTALGIVVPYLMIARYVPWSEWPAAVIAITAAVFIVPQNAKHAKYQGMVLDERYHSIMADIRTGMPMDVLADRHVDFWLRTREGWLKLWGEKFSLLRDVPAPVERWTMTRAKFVRDGEHTEKHSTWNRYRVDLGSEKPVSIIRVKFKPLDQVTWEPIMFEWIDPHSGEKKRSTVRPWVRPIDQDTVFWIDGPISGGELLMGRKDCRFDIQSVEYAPRMGQ